MSTNWHFLCIYYSTQACILVFDVTNKLSFDSLDYWLQEFTSNGGKQAILAVVANKVRLVRMNVNIVYFILGCNRY